MPEKIGKYSIVERIGRGGMGTIFKAHDPLLDRLVAIKVISADVEVTDELRTRFFREARACARLSHSNIVTIYDIGEDDGRLFIVMELLEGQELRRMMADRTTMALQDKLSIMVQVCEGLHYAHQRGIVHRDVKPANLMLLPNGHVKILDFGVAHIATVESGLTRTGLIMGTLRYIAPEQLQGRADHRSDQFSAGAVFYELLSGRPPFTGDDPIQILEQIRTSNPPRLDALLSGVPAELASIVERAIQKDAAARFTDLGEMRAQLVQAQRALAEENISRPPAATETLIARAGVLAPPLDQARELTPAGHATDAVPTLERTVAPTPEPESAAATLADARLPVSERSSTPPGPRRYRRWGFAVSGFVLALAGAAAVMWGVVARPSKPATPVEAPAPMTGPATSKAPPPTSSEQPATDSPKPMAPPDKADVLARALAEAQREQSAAVDARRDAGTSEVSRLAARTLSAARSKEVEGEAALRRDDPESATALFREAQRGYRSAIEEAAKAAAAEENRRIAAVQRGQAEAERARQATVGARRAAERAATERYAPRQLTSAQAKERDAEAALGRSDFGEASRLYAEAQSAYLSAVQETERQVGSVKSTAAQSRRLALARRDEALHTEADRLSKDLFAGAQARQADAEGLLDRQDYAAATQAYKEAAERYEESGRRAKLAQDARAAADQARARMLGEKQRAAPDTREFAEALTQERQGAQLYQSAAYQEANQRFQAAATLFAKAVARPAERAPESSSAAEEIRGVLNTYARAFEAKDVTLIQKIRPGLKPQEANQLRISFDQSKDYRLSLKVDSIDVRGDEAVVKGQREDNVTSKNNQSYRNASSFTFRFKRTSAGWIIDAVGN
ncbi:MAG TPA: protein kinase [Candidatus Methylomirabilis sp.]|nr:protein kinase [Candidatus Methylomirabilis sp.]